MKAQITVQQLWWNPSVCNFFMREQAKKHFEETVNKDEKTLIDLENFAEEIFSDIDEFEEFLYNCEPEEIREDIKRGYFE